MVTVTQNGPYVITGSIELLGQSMGEGASTEHYTLSRCGGSKNKPFCDGAHWHIGFKDEKNRVSIMSMQPCVPINRRAVPLARTRKH